MKKYYHGTDPRFLYRIMTEGFRLGIEYRCGNVSGYGLYVSTRPESAAHWAGQAYSIPGRPQYAVVCKIDPSTRILWRESDWDQKVIQSLERKFGKAVTDNYDFWKAIPKNKRLTGKELVALVSYRFIKDSIRWGRKREKYDDKKYRHLSRLSKIIRGYGYDALGDRSDRAWDSDEIMVYNPSKVTPVSVHKMAVTWLDDDYTKAGVHYGPALSLEEIKFISDTEEADWQKILKEDENRKEVS